MLPTHIEQALLLISTWVRDLTDDWLVVKCELIGELDNEHRKLLSRRDPKTKEQPELNELEKQIMILWKNTTGVDLVVLPRKERKQRDWWEPGKNTTMVGVKKITAAKR